MKRTFTYTILALMALSVGSCTKNELGQSADTIKKLQTDFYFMDVTGSVGFDEFLENGGAKSSDDVSEFLSGYLSAGPFGKLKTKVSTDGPACSALKVKDEKSGYLVGRNYDWDECTTMIIRQVPATGYASLSTVNLDFLGFGEGYKPEGMINGFKATAGVYVPMDGINEKGLVVADLMAGDSEVTDQQTSKVDLTTTTAIRYLLNTAANVDEAIKALEGIDMHSDIQKAHHLFIADASGRSVTTEWVNNQMIVTPTDVLNNHYLCSEKAGIGNGEMTLEHERKLIAARDKSEGVMNAEKLADTMFEVLELPTATYTGGTQWTIVFDTKNCTATWYWKRDRARSYTYQVK